MSAADLLEQMSAFGAPLPFPLSEDEARRLLEGDIGFLQSTWLIHFMLPTPMGLGPKALLPGGFGYRATEADPGYRDLRLNSADGEIARLQINVDERALVSAIVSPEADVAIGMGLLFAAVVSVANDAGLDEIGVLVRSDRPNAVAAMGHGFGGELRAIVAGESWQPQGGFQ